jgi:hypothetical protein
VTRLPILFRYLYENFQLRDARKYGDGFYILDSRTTPNKMIFSPVTTEVIQDAGRVLLRPAEPTACLLVSLDLIITYPRSILLRRPSGAVVTSHFEGKVVQSSRLVPLDNGKKFSSIISLMNPAEFSQLFGDSELRSPWWDEIEIQFQAIDLVDTLPSTIEVLSVGCFNKYSSDQTNAEIH